MNPSQFQQLVEKSVLQYPLSEGQQEERIIGLTDLVYFVDSYRPSLKIVEDQPIGFNIVEDGSQRVGIVMCEAGTPHLEPSAAWESVSVLKHNEALAAVWLVLVISSQQAATLPEETTANKLPDPGYDRVFAFDFFSRRVRSLK